MAGYQATIVVEDPSGCPVAQAAERVDATVESVSRSARRGSETVVEEFTIRDPGGTLEGRLDRETNDGMESDETVEPDDEHRENAIADPEAAVPPDESTTRADGASDRSPTRVADPDGTADQGESVDPDGTADPGGTVGTAIPAGEAGSGSRSVDTETSITEEPIAESSIAQASTGSDRGGVTLEPVAATETDRTYRFTRDWTTDCVCEVVEAGGNPVASLRAVDGALHVTVTAPDLEGLSRTVTDLKAGFDGVELHEITQSTTDDDTDLVLIDRARLTDRQREVIETAHELGYFQYPKGANAGEVAATLGISGSTFAEHLAAAQSKLLDAVLTN